MQSYSDESATTAGPSNFMPSNTALNRAQPMNGRRDDFGKYRNLYEQNMNPFEAFRGRVSVLWKTAPRNLKNHAGSCKGRPSSQSGWEGRAYTNAGDSRATSDTNAFHYLLPRPARSCFLRLLWMCLCLSVAGPSKAWNIRQGLVSLLFHYSSYICKLYYP